MPRTQSQEELDLLESFKVSNSMNENNNDANNTASIDIKIDAATQAVSIGTRLLAKLEDYEVKRNNNRS